MGKLKLILLISIILNMFTSNAQNKYQLSIGTSLPDNISNKYLKPGIYLAYGIDFKLSSHFLINTSFSISYNGKNPSYRNGFDDDPYIIANPDEKKFYEYIITNQMEELFTDPLYLFNPLIDLKIKYLFFNEKKISSYFFAGISGSYTLLKDPIISFSVNENGEVWGYGFSEGGLEHQFNIGYMGGIGLNYNFENNKSIFIESHYTLQPNVKFGVNNDRVGLFIINASISFPFK